MNITEIESTLRYVRDLAAREVHAIGWIPDTVYAPAISKRRIKIVEHNGQPCGFIFHGPELPTVRIYQTAVEHDCRLLDHGRELFLHALCQGLAHEVEQITWICAEDLPANAFWHRVSGPPKHLAYHRKQGRRPRYEYAHVLPRGKDLEQYLEDQLKQSPIWKLAKLQGIDQQVEGWFKKRFRAH